MKNAKKIIALSLWALAASPVWAGLGSLQVHSALGEPFAGSITVNGAEVAALQQGQFSLSGAPLQAKVSRQEHSAVIYLRSVQPIHDPVFSFNLQVGNQARQYVTLLDPPAYQTADSHQARLSAARTSAGSQTYQTRSDENLIDVARKFQPQGLNLAQTMRALVAANPRAFRNHNPDFMYRNVKLRIPSDREMRELSKVRPKPKTKAVRSADKAAPAVKAETAAQTVADQERADTQASATPPAEQKAIPAVTDAVKKEVAPAVAGAATATQTAASEVAAQAASATAQAASEAKTAVVSAASAAVTQTASAVDSAVAMVKSKTEPKAAPQPVKETADNGWLQYALIGGGIVVLLLLALALWQRARKRYNEEDEAAEDDSDSDDDSILFLDTDQPADNTPAAQPKSQAASAVKSNAAPQASADQSESEDDDWAWLEDTDIPQDLSNSESGSDPKPATAAADEVKAPTPTPATQDDDEWLNFNFDHIGEAEQSTTQPEKSLSATEAAKQSDEEALDLDWLNETDSGTDEIAGTVPRIQPEHTEHDDEGLEWVADNTEPQTADSLSVSDASATESTDWDSLNFDDDSAFSTTYTQPAKDDTPPVNPVSDTTQPKGSDDIDWSSLGLDGADETATQPDETLATEPEPEPVASTFNDDDLGDFDFSSDAIDRVVNKPENSSPFATGHVDFSNTKPQEDKPEERLSDTDMVIPLQAKLELAQMYLEMDDAVTARQTLRELLEEANGEVLAKAQALLQQLGG